MQYLTAKEILESTRDLFEVAPGVEGPPAVDRPVPEILAGVSKTLIEGIRAKEQAKKVDNFPPVYLKSSLTAGKREISK